jgi:hypothetical protein
LIINNKNSDLVEIADIDDKYYIEVILIQKPNCYFENLSKMFCECERLIGINEYFLHDLIDFREVEDISCMFMNCKMIQIIKLGLFKNLFRGNKNMNMKNLFYGCEELTTIEGLDTNDTNNATSVENMFYGCKKYQMFDNNISINNNEVSELNKKSEKEKIPDMDNLLENGNFKEAFENAIKTEKFDILYQAIKSYMLSLSLNEIEEIDFSKDNLKDIAKIIINGIKGIRNGKCDNLIPIIMFIKKEFVDKKNYDKDLSKAINDLYKKRDILKKFEIKFEEKELKEIVDFYNNI